MFDAKYRERVSRSILDIASSDPRVEGAAIVGSLALTSGDRFSDIDVTFSVRDHVNLLEVLESWTVMFAAENDIDVLFDFHLGPSIYRVFLFPHALQVDLSVTSTAAFGPRGDTFRLLFGHVSTSLGSRPRSANEMAGYAVHHALHARTSIERGKRIQAAYWISELRNEVVAIAASQAGFESSQARGAHLLSADFEAMIARTLPTSIHEDELRDALKASIELLLVDKSNLLSPRIESQLRSLAFQPLD